jgi:tryptophan-rich sensory protein
MIGGLYYVICFVILYRLFSLPPGTARNVGLVLLGTLMFINALWNYFFFRSRNLFHAYLLGLPYGLVALALFVLLLRLDCVAAWCLFPYILYLFYANIWGYRVWKLNLPRPNEA